NLEARPLPGILCCQLTTHLVDDAVTQGKPQPCPVTGRLGRHEGFKYPGQHSRGDPVTVVLHDNEDVGLGAVTGDLHPRRLRSADLPVAHSVLSIEQKVEQYLFEPVRVPHHRGHLPPDHLKLDAGLFHAVLDQQHDIIDALARVEGQAPDFRTSPEDAHMVHYSRSAGDLALHPLQLHGQIIGLQYPLVQAFGDIGQGHAHDRERLIDLVRQACSHFSEGGHLGTMKQLLPGFVQLGVVPAYRLYLHQPSVAVEQASFRPDPQGVTTITGPGFEFDGAYRIFRGQAGEPDTGSLVIFLVHELREIEITQLL